MSRLIAALCLSLGLLWALPVQAATFFDTDFESCAASPGNDWPCESWNDFNNETICTTNRLQVTTEQAFSGSKAVKLTYNNVNGSTCQPSIVHSFTASRHIFYRAAMRQQAGFQYGSNGGSKRVRFRPANTAGNPTSLGPYPIFWLYNYFGNYAINIESPYDAKPGGFWIIGSAPTPSAWDQVEMEILINDPGQANGLVRLWVNNTVRAESLGRQWVGPAQSSTGPGGLWHPSDWFSQNAEVFLQSGNGTLYYDRIAVGNTRIGLIGSTLPPSDTTAPSPPTNVTVN
jgi:hypothetical protein